MPLSQTVENLKQALQSCPTVKALETICQTHNVTPWYVGGLVRDYLLMGVLSDDIDVVLPSKWAKPIALELAEVVQSNCIILDESFGIYRVFDFANDVHIDIAACVGTDIHADLHRRDVTLNAIALSLTSNSFLDPTGGLVDIQNKQLRMVNFQNMLDDPLRFLRVFRLSAQLGFTIAADFLVFTQNNAHLLARVAAERIQFELCKLFSAPHCAQAIRAMADTGLLEIIFPELSAMHPIPGNQYHHLILWDHTLELLVQAERHFPDLPIPVQELLNQNFSPDLTRFGVARLACLLHDVGKPATMHYSPEEDRYRFYGHDAASALISKGIGLRLKWGNALTKNVCDLVRWHLYPGDVVKPDTSLKSYRKFFRRIGDLLPEMMVLSLADRFSALGPAISTDELDAFKAGIIGLWDKHSELMQNGDVIPHSLLSGQEVMHVLGIKEGPEVGKVLRQIEMAYLNDEISSQEEAINYLHQYKNI